MPERILKHLETIERMARTASHTVDLLKKLGHLAVLFALIFAIIRVGNASSDSCNAAAEKFRREIELKREWNEIHAASEIQTQELLIEVLQELRAGR